MRTVVTGAAGFVGTVLVDHLRRSGDEVLGLDRAADITDYDTIRHAIAAHRPETVFHLAAATHVGESWSTPGLVLRVNAEGTLNVLRACTEVGVGRVLVVGSAEEYGKVAPDEGPLTEDAPLRPLTPYGASKVAAEYLAIQAHLADGLGAIRVRSFNHTGAGQSARFVVPALAQRIAGAERDGRNQVPVGSLAPVRDFTDVADVVAAYRLVVTRGEPGEVYNVCSGTGRSVAEIASVLVSLARRPIALVPDPDLIRPVEVPRLVGDNTKIHKATGWAPQIPLADSLSAVLDRWRNEPG